MRWWTMGNPRHPIDPLARWRLGGVPCLRRPREAEGARARRDACLASLSPASTEQRRQCVAWSVPPLPHVGLGSAERERIIRERGMETDEAEAGVGGREDEVLGGGLKSRSGAHSH